MGNRIRAILLAGAFGGTGALYAASAPYGYGELKLGMSLTEADALREDDRVEACKYEHASRCLVRKDTAFSRKARVVASIDDATRQISAINIEIEDFSQKKGYPCSHVADAVIRGVTDAYGEPTCDNRRIGCVWHRPDGLEIKAFIFCSGTDPSSGMINLRFAQAGVEQ